MTGKIRNFVVLNGARFLKRLFNFLPRPTALLLGETLGLAAFIILKKENHSALINLDRAYGDSLSHRRRNKIARDCFVTFGRSIADMMRLPGSYNDGIRPNIEIVGEKHFQKAYSRGRGVVVFTGHVGNFELLAAYVARSGYKTAVIGRELYDKRLDRLLVANREAMGIVNIYSDASPRAIMRYLNNGYVIGILIDTDSFRVGGELTPFFSRPAKTPTGPTQLGLITGAAFLPMFCLSFPGGMYKIYTGPELQLESRDRSRENVYRITCRMTKAIEDMIRSHPEQWIWMHNRWHTRPEEDDRKFLASLGMEI